MTFQTCVHRAELVTKVRKRQLYEFSDFIRGWMLRPLKYDFVLSRPEDHVGGERSAWHLVPFFRAPCLCPPRQLPTSTQTHQAAPPRPGGREQGRGTVLLSPGGVSAVGPTASYLLLGINYPQLSDFPTAICIVAHAPVGQECGGPSGDGALLHVTEHPRSHVWCLTQLEWLRGLGAGDPSGSHVPGGLSSHCWLRVSCLLLHNNDLKL